MRTPCKHSCPRFNQGISPKESWKAWRASSSSFYYFSSLVLVLLLEFYVGILVFFWIVKCNLDITRFGSYSCSPGLGGPRPKGGDTVTGRRHLLPVLISCSPFLVL